MDRGVLIEDREGSGSQQGVCQKASPDNKRRGKRKKTLMAQPVPRQSSTSDEVFRGLTSILLHSMNMHVLEESKPLLSLKSKD